MSGLPSLGRGRPTAAKLAEYQAEVRAFCARIVEIDSTLDFKVSSRGWCYLLEGQGTITKGEFDAGQRLINDCRKDGSLPLDICAVDDKRTAGGLEGHLDTTSVEEEAESIVESVKDAHEYYRPSSFWEELDTYVEVAVEKVDLKSLFESVCDSFHVPIQNIGGWCDINGRAAMMGRFQKHERAGRRPVLLYCGDHDPCGLQISGLLRSNMADLERAVR
jgi:hypothetical protein